MTAMSRRVLASVDEAMSDMPRTDESPAKIVQLLHKVAARIARECVTSFGTTKSQPALACFSYGASGRRKSEAIFAVGIISDDMAVLSAMESVRVELVLVLLSNKEDIVR